MVILLIFSFLIGLAFGSFANVLIYRLPNNLSIVSPPSFCPSCKTKIPFYYNIPLLSFIVLRGKCFNCKERISFRYPLVELLVGVLFWFATYNYIPIFPPNLMMIIQLFFIYFFLFSITCLIFIDLEHQILPDKITIPGIFLGFISSFFLENLTPLESFLGALLGAFVPTILILIYLLRGIEAMGWGDVKMMAMVGAFLGYKGAILTFLFGSLLGTIIGGLYLLITSKDRRTPLPFGTFLGIASFISLFYGEIFIRWYFEVSGTF